jgi:hypothetical protein
VPKHKPAKACMRLGQAMLVPSARIRLLFNLSTPTGTESAHFHFENENKFSESQLIQTIGNVCGIETSENVRNRS